MSDLIDIVLSIHKRHADAILDGRKTVEWRVRPPRDQVNRVWLYETKGTGSGLVVGSAAVVGTIDLPKNPWHPPEPAAWDEYGAMSGDLTEDEFRFYFLGVPRATGLLLSDPQRCDRFPLSDFGLTRPPQSWCYRLTGARQ